MTMMMKIGFDAKRLFHNRTGLGNYSRDLVKAMQVHFPENDYFLFSPTDSHEERSKTISSASNTTTVTAPARFKKFKSLWRTLVLDKVLNTKNMDIYHGLSHEMPRKSIKSKVKYVVTIHDLIFIRYPENYPLLDRKIYRKKVEYASRTADHIVAISEQTKRDLVHYFHIPEQKISVVYQSCADIFKSRIDLSILNEVENRFGLPEKFILNVGTIEKRKNLLTLLQANSQTQTQLPIVVIGAKKDLFQELRHWIGKNPNAPEVIFLEGVKLDELAAIYQLATLFVYPSKFEGFGIPVLEALYSGTAVIAASGSCLEEAGGPNSLYHKPEDRSELSEAIDKVLLNEDLRKDMVVSGLAYAKKFSDKNQADALMKIYSSLV